MKMADVVEMSKEQWCLLVDLDEARKEARKMPIKRSYRPAIKLVDVGFAEWDGPFLGISRSGHRYIEEM